MSTETRFTKENIDKYLNTLAKEYKKRNRKASHAELILVGGASVIINYGFRDMTTDIDAIILADSVMKEAIYAVAEKEGLHDGWLNADFKRSASFSNKLIQNSEYYRTFANIMDVRTIKREYLLAMKLVAGRNYKRDLSDIAGILIASEQQNKPVTREGIDNAVNVLYGGWEGIDDYTIEYLDKLLNCENRSALYEQVKDEENKNKIIRFSELQIR